MADSIPRSSKREMTSFWRHVSPWYMAGTVVTFAVAGYLFIVLGNFPLVFCLLWVVVNVQYYSGSRELEAENARREAGKEPAEAGAQGGLFNQLAGPIGYPLAGSFRYPLVRAICAVAYTVLILGGGVFVSALLRPEYFTEVNPTAALIWGLAGFVLGAVILWLAMWAERRRRVAQMIGSEA